MTKLNKKGKIIIALSAIGLVIILIGVWLLIGFFAPPSSYALRVTLVKPINYQSETPFDKTKPFEVGDKIAIVTFLYNNKYFPWQKLMYADSGPVYCSVTIETVEGVSTENILLLDSAEYYGHTTQRIKQFPYTTIAIEQLSGDVYSNRLATQKSIDYEFTEAGTYTFTCYAAFMQCGQSFYVEMTPTGSMTVIVE